MTILVAMITDLLVVRKGGWVARLGQVTDNKEATNEQGAVIMMIKLTISFYGFTCSA